MTERFVAYRHAAYDTPWWAFPSSRSGRFHRSLLETVQYVCLHPLGPAAEVLRHHVGPEGSPDDLVLNLWGMVVDREGIVDITFDNCGDFGITPDDLVGDDYGPTQALGRRLRDEGFRGLNVPSAALPGTDNAVLFGARVSAPYLLEPLSPDEVPTGHLTDGARPPLEVASLVRWIGEPHRSLEQWRATGRFERLIDPLGRRR